MMKLQANTEIVGIRMIVPQLKTIHNIVKLCQDRESFRLFDNHKVCNFNERSQDDNHFNVTKIVKCPEQK